MSLKESICLATDELNTLRRERATYDDLKVAAIKVLELRQQAEKAFSGKAKTKITAVTIAALIR